MEIQPKTPLTDAVARDVAPTDKPRKLFDSETPGLFLFVTKVGADGSCGRYWRLRYWFGGKEKLLSLGVYPRVRIAAARKKAEAAKDDVANGIDPSAKRKAEKVADAVLFADVAEEFLKTRAASLADRTLEKARWQLREFVNPWLGKRPIAKIEAPELLTVLRRIESRGQIETTHKVHQLCGRVFRFGIATGRCKRDVAADLRGALAERPADAGYAAITDPAKVGELLRAIDGYSGQPATEHALRLLPHVFLRSLEFRGGRWDEVDFKKALWTVPAARMKGKTGKKREHLVPLSRQSLAILKSLHKITGHGEFMFPAIGSEPRPISENTIGAALRGLGIDSDTHVPHGFRKTASTLMHEAGELSTDIELQLAHVDTNKVRGIYNKAERLAERAKMMQRWSDYLDALKADVPKRKRA